MKKLLLFSFLLLSPLVAKNSFYIGFQDTLFSNGLSLKYDVSHKTTLQAVLGGFGNTNTFNFRGLYKFKRKRRWNVYGIGSLGFYRFNNGNSSNLGLGIGAGIEYDLRGLDSSFIPLFVNLEFGIALANNFSNGANLGLGLHYQF